MVTRDEHDVEFTHMLDTNMVSYIVRGQSMAASDHLAGLSKSPGVCVSAISAAEIRYGISRKPKATKLNFLMIGFFTKVAVLPWGEDEANVYGRVRAELERRGAGLSMMDTMIAAHAIVTGLTLVTNDRAFGRVEGLRVENWATDV